MAKETTAFEKKVLAKVRLVPVGKVTTYKLLAKAIKRPKAFRVVGNALNKNLDLIKIPCHRVVMSDGCVGGYVKGEKNKIKILASEGISFKNKKIVDFGNRLVKF